MSKIIEFLELLWNLIFGGGKLKRVSIKERCFMPLFCVKANGGPQGTWEYLSLSDNERAYLRDYLKRDAASGETPAITFCLTPSNVNGGLISNAMINVSEESLNILLARCEDLVRDGIAVFPCLYCDDPSGNMPRWWEMEKHLAVWKAVHAKIGTLVTGYILSIESSEKGNIGTVQHYIQKIRDNMPGVDYYGTHLQWKTRNTPYVWNGSNTPANADIILVETPNDPNVDVPVNVVMSCYNEIKNANPNLHFVMHEYNLHVGSGNVVQARAELRRVGAWGVG